MKKQYTQTIFWLLFINFLFLLCMFFIPVVRDLMQGKQFLIPIAIFFALGILLIIFTVKEKMQGKQKRFLLLTGGSAAGFFIGVILHNMVSGLLTLILGYEFEEPVFFILAVIIMPITFLVGMIGSIVLLIKKNK